MNHVVGASNGHLERTVLVFPEDHVQFVAGWLRQGFFDETSNGTYLVQQARVIHFVKRTNACVILEQKPDQSCLAKEATDGLRNSFAILASSGAGVDGVPFSACRRGGCCTRTASGPTRR
jgi:hypothetical protein